MSVTLNEGQGHLKWHQTVDLNGVHCQIRSEGTWLERFECKSMFGEGGGGGSSWNHHTGFFVFWIFIKQDQMSMTQRFIRLKSINQAASIFSLSPTPVALNEGQGHSDLNQHDQFSSSQNCWHSKAAVMSLDWEIHTLVVLECSAWTASTPNQISRWSIQKTKQVLLSPACVIPCQGQGHWK